MSDPVAPGQPQQPIDDETMQALLGLHPHQIAIAQALANGNGPTRPPDDAGAQPSVISRPNSGPRGISVPPAPEQGSTADLEARADQPRQAPAAVVPSQHDTDEAELQRKASTGSGIEQWANRHGIGGQIVRGLAGVGGALAPGISAAIPGTEQHHQVLLHQDAARVAHDTGQEEDQAKTAQEGATLAGTQANTAHTQQETKDLQNPQPKPKDEEWSVIPGMTGQNGEVLQQEKTSGQVRLVPGTSGTKSLKEPAPVRGEKITRMVGGVPHEVLVNAETGEDIKDEGQTKEEKNPSDAGTWTLQEDPQGKSVLMNSKTGETKPAEGVVPKGTGAKKQADYEKNIAGPNTDLEYAKDYTTHKIFTGPGDEALMEKFFDLAKPSSGFRMSQPQITMLNTARSWMGGMEAHVRHATTGTWFSDEQRQQIADTMQQLATLKLNSAKSGPQGSAEGAGGGSKGKWDPIKGQYVP
jgi:hypothetical protein